MTKMMYFSAHMELLRSVQMKYHDASWREQAKILDGFSLLPLIMIVNMRFRSTHTRFDQPKRTAGKP